MKVLILGWGKWYENEGCEPRNQACTLKEWNSLVNNKENQIVTLDMDDNILPDIVATLPYDSHTKTDWMYKVGDKYGRDFDVIIDSISHISYVWQSKSYMFGADYLLKLGGVFHAYKATEGLQKGTKIKYRKK